LIKAVKEWGQMGQDKIPLPL